mgnify:CR=1 FL=1
MLELKHISYAVREGDSELGILNDISLTIDDHRLVVFTGPNGGGKTTLAKIIMGLVRPTAGRILWNGQDITGLGITLLVVFGIKAIANFATVFVPLFVIVVIVAAAIILQNHSLTELLTTAPPGPALSLGAATTMVAGGFIAGAICTPDYARFLKNGTQVFWMTLIGTFVGILPGTGAATAAFLSYGEARRSSPRRENIGKGEPDGIIAAESSNNAVTGGALVPSLALGIPGDPVTAIMLATLTIHGVTPGVRLMTENPEMVYATFAVLMLSNLLMYPSCIITTRMFSFLLRIPEQLLMGFIAVLCILGSYGSRGNLFDVFVTVFMGIAAYFMRRMEFPLPPLVIGLVLGQQFEMSIGQMMLFKGDDSWLAFVSASPIAMVLLGMAFLLLVVPQVQNYRALRAKR